MPVTYHKADDDVLKISRDIIRQYHRDLKELEVKISYLMAVAPKDDNGNPVSPAVSLNGYPCAAKVKVLPLIQRVDGRGDAEVVIDADGWNDLSDPERASLIDHELYHLEPQRDEEGNWKADDIGRPILKVKKHDHQFGWFNAIAARHADASYEVKQAKAFADKFGQTYFGWGAPPDAGIEAGPSPVEGVSSATNTITKEAAKLLNAAKSLRAKAS